MKRDDIIFFITSTPPEQRLKIGPITYQRVRNNSNNYWEPCLPDIGTQRSPQSLADACLELNAQPQRVGIPRGGAEMPVRDKLCREVLRRLLATRVQIAKLRDKQEECEQLLRAMSIDPALDDARLQEIYTNLAPLPKKEKPPRRPAHGTASKG